MNSSTKFSKHEFYAYMSPEALEAWEIRRRDQTMAITMEEACKFLKKELGPDHPTTLLLIDKTKKALKIAEESHETWRSLSN